MFNWLSLVIGAPKNYLAYFKPGTGVRLTDLSSFTTNTIITQAVAAGASFADAGSRLYVGFYNSNGLGVAGGQVYGADFNASDPLFPAPLTVVPTITEPGIGVITPGPHRFGYLVTSRTGAIGKPSPAPSDIFAPVTFTSTGKNINAQFTTTWPTYASQVQLIMTPTTNLNDYRLVPGAFVLVPGGALFTVNITFSISDQDLIAQGPSATPYANLLTNSVSGAVAFQPTVIFQYLQRMVYITVDQFGFPLAYVSEPSNYQQLTDSQHRVALPGNRQITTGFTLRGVLYLIGPRWTYSTSDNGQVPVNWPEPQLVDGSIGTQSPYGVWVDAAQGFAWVADVSGLFLFLGGQYPQLPINYYQYPDWQRINWGAAMNVFVVDDFTNKRVEVMAPLDGATTPTHRMTWDYTDGIDPKQVKYSINPIAGYSYGAFTIVKHPTTKRLEVWCAPSVAGSIIRQNNGLEANPYRDVASAINCIYEGALQPGQDGQHGFINFHHGRHLRIFGNGQCQPTFFALDHAFSFTPPAFTLQPTMGKEVEIKCNDMPTEHSSLQLQINQLDGFFVMSKDTAYYSVGPMVH